MEPTAWQFRYGYETKDGEITLSRIYDNWDDCYSDYCACMGRLYGQGVDLASMKWRGTPNLEQIALIVMGKSIYFNYVTVGEV